MRLNRKSFQSEYFLKCVRIIVGVTNKCMEESLIASIELVGLGLSSMLCMHEYFNTSGPSLIKF